MSDDGNAAIFTGTNFDTGDSVTVCATCMVSFCATIVEGMTGLPVSALIDSLESGEIVADAELGTDDVDGESIVGLIGIDEADESDNDADDSTTDND